jgi:hypothetical protein
MARQFKLGDLTLSAVFEALPTGAITGFIALCIDLERDGHQAPSQRFVINIPVTGMPSNRDALLTAAMLANAEDVARYIMLLAGGANELPGSAGEFVLGPGASDLVDGKGQSVQEGLLESLVRALHSHPGGLDEIDKTMQDLRTAGVAEQRFPKEWDAIWQPIWQARKELASAD